MKHTHDHIKKTSIFAHLKLHSIALANSLVAIVTLRSVVHGFETYDSTVPMSIWCPMGAIILLTLTILANFINSVKLIRTWRHSSNGGNQTYTERYKN